MTYPSAFPRGWQIYFWFWHLLYDNRVFGRRLHDAVCKFRAHRWLIWDYGDEIYGLNYHWREGNRRRNLVIRIPANFGEPLKNDFRIVTHAW